MARYALSDFALSIVSFHEQVLGANSLITRARKPAELIRAYALMSAVHQGYMTAPVLPFDATALSAFDGLRALGVRVSTMDLRIASIALSQSLVLLTRNSVDFGRVPGLKIEDWTK